MKVTIEGDGVTATIEDDGETVSECFRLCTAAMIAVGFGRDNVREAAADYAESIV